jgi:hypothetical protein
MKASGCYQADGYVGKWLTNEERIEFEMHLGDCPDCRQFVDECQRLESLLARANAACVPVPPALIGRIEHRIRKRRRKAAAWAASLAAAGVLICAILAWYVVQRVPNARSVQPPVVAQLPQPAALMRVRDPRPSVEVTFEPSSDVIAVPHRTDNPSVTIIWVYPTIKMDQGSSPEPSEFPSLERNGI